LSHPAADFPAERNANLRVGDHRRRGANEGSFLIATNAEELGTVVIAVNHMDAGPILARLHPPVVRHLSLHATQYGFAKLCLEDRGPPSNFSTAFGVSSPTCSRAQATFPKASLAEDLDQLASVAHEAGRFLDRLPLAGLLAVLALIGNDTLNAGPT
jgi:hypothetical protein